MFVEDVASLILEMLDLGLPIPPDIYTVNDCALRRIKQIVGLVYDAQARRKKNATD